MNQIMETVLHVCRDSDAKIWYSFCKCYW